MQRIEIEPSDQSLIHELQLWLNAGTLYQATLSGPRMKGEDHPQKTVVRPVQLKDGLIYQFEVFYAKKVLHYNYEPQEASNTLYQMMKHVYKQTFIKSAEAELQILVNKKKELKVKRKNIVSAQSVVHSHNRIKNRVLEEGKPAAFLVELGIMNNEGKVLAKKQDKFRQINRFLEMVEDVMDHLPTNQTLKVVDFGCGKSYLTFALYHYLVILQQRNVKIIGLDLKKDVIAFCSDLAQKLNYSELEFMVGDIAEYEGLTEADMVVTLHACDTATDAAIAKAVNWGASVIMSVPCCQHELFPQLNSEILQPILAQGLLKERFSALATDAIRGQLLEAIGYKVQMLEFVDPEHTPKNLLIRAVKPESLMFNNKKWEQYKQFKHFISADPALERELKSYLIN